MKANLKEKPYIAASPVLHRGLRWSRMKEVMICFSFSVKDGHAKIAYECLSSLAGWCTDGIKNTERRIKGLKLAFLLLEGIANITDDSYIQSVTLRERKQAKHPDDLKGEK